MRIRWTTTVADDLASIVEYIWKNNPEAAQRVAEVVFESIETGALYTGFNWLEELTRVSDQRLLVVRNVYCLPICVNPC